jgi:uncharacterized protein (TIGR04255 family)
LQTRVYDTFILVIHNHFANSRAKSLPVLLPSPHYPRAPITEAVIQLRSSSEIGARQQEKIAKRLKRDYPHSQPLHEVAVAIDNTGGNVAITQNIQGFRLANDDQTNIVILDSRSLTAARLPPYPGWDTLRNNARGAWRIWTELVTHHSIERLGIRFINRIDIPNAAEPVVHLEQYLRFHPQVTTITPAPLLGYVMQVVVPTFDPAWTATVTSTILPIAPIPNHTSIILDIDIFRTAKIPNKVDDLWAAVDEGRALKNDIFERCITDHSRKLFS